MKTSQQDFLDHAKEIVLLHLEQPDFCANSFSKAIYLSRSQLHRRLKELTGKSTTEFIRAVKMQQAASLLSADKNNVCQAAYAVGFNNLSYFTKCFKAEFGILPSEYKVVNKTAL